MKNILVTLIYLITFSYAFGQNKSSIGDYQKGEVLVHLKPEIKVKDFIQKLNSENNDLYSISVKKETVKRLNIYLFQFNENQISTADFLAWVNQKSGILAAQLNYRVQFRDSIPDDPFFGDQWGLDKIQAPDAWSTATGGNTELGDEIVVAVIDKGFDINHEDLAGNLWANPAEIPNNGIDDDANGLEDDIYGWNYNQDMANHPNDLHGTAVAGIIGANGNNSTGVTGVNWNVKLMLFTTIFVDEIVAAYGYALEQRIKYNESDGAEGAFVVATNASLGLNNQFCSAFPIWGAMYDFLGNAGIINATATTNSSGTDVDSNGDMPTTCPSTYMIAVTNTDINDERDGGFGATSIDLGAPGTASVTTRPNSLYNTDFGGTSASAPHVAGAIGLLYSVPCLEFAELAKTDPIAAGLLVKDAILEGVDEVSELQDETTTGGRLNVYNSMLYLHAYCISDDDEQNSGSFINKYIDKPDFINVYPNPLGDLAETLFVDYTTLTFEPISIQVFNTLGQLVFEDTIKPALFSPQTYELNVFNLARGTYFINIAGIDEKITAKFLK